MPEDIEVVLRKVKGGYVIVRTRGVHSGQRLPQTRKPVSREHAVSILRAIKAHQNRIKFGGMRNRGHL